MHKKIIEEGRFSYFLIKYIFKNKKGCQKAVPHNYPIIGGITGGIRDAVVVVGVTQTQFT
ncbi:hypothetical protein CSC2_15470 [Clostridium zeae]|uniref:Uncharacterized protein n=1 Tax=Clostridium zeae TaxID=2759022 RepID=A0ABQ1E8B3_9CLOT|nr:hypothetical protein CSC2_15470 [Clostridium zeae]